MLIKNAISLLVLLKMLTLEFGVQSLKPAVFALVVTLRVSLKFYGVVKVSFIVPAKIPLSRFGKKMVALIRN